MGFGRMAGAGAAGWGLGKIEGGAARLGRIGLRGRSMGNQQILTRGYKRMMGGGLAVGGMGGMGYMGHRYSSARNGLQGRSSGGY